MIFVHPIYQSEEIVDAVKSILTNKAVPRKYLALASFALQTDKEYLF